MDTFFKRLPITIYWLSILFTHKGIQSPTNFQSFRRLVDLDWRLAIHLSTARWLGWDGTALQRVPLFVPWQRQYQFAGLRKGERLGESGTD